MGEGELEFRPQKQPNSTKTGVSLKTGLRGRKTLPSIFYCTICAGRAITTFIYRSRHILDSRGYRFGDPRGSIQKFDDSDKTGCGTTLMKEHTAHLFPTENLDTTW